ncbi:hypothetical protein V5O48_006445 [Marasmius crinis-equi]|uniref:Uncharacterized protein n=1 Tax=Marasmius crinis-equi TaxID=585013 RepID=A0ABR3FKC9_9AGAR
MVDPNEQKRDGVQALQAIFNRAQSLTLMGGHLYVPPGRHHLIPSLPLLQHLCLGDYAGRQPTWFYDAVRRSPSLGSLALSSRTDSNCVGEVMNPNIRFMVIVEPSGAKIFGMSHLPEVLERVSVDFRGDEDTIPLLTVDKRLNHLSVQGCELDSGPLKLFHHIEIATQSLILYHPRIGALRFPVFYRSGIAKLSISCGIDSSRHYESVYRTKIFTYFSRLSVLEVRFIKEYPTDPVEFLVADIFEQLSNSTPTICPSLKSLVMTGGSTIGTDTLQHLVRMLEARATLYSFTDACIIATLLSEQTYTGEPRARLQSLGNRGAIQLRVRPLNPGPSEHHHHSSNGRRQLVILRGDYLHFEAATGADESDPCCLQRNISLVEGYD